jgi:acyl-CoA synthetase (AMP-forming)/AMP-acid ligase II
MHPRDIALSSPDRLAVAVVSDQANVPDSTLTYRQLVDASDKLSAVLQECGLKAGDTIALCMENRPEYFVVCWAAFNLGLYFTPISTRLTAREIAYIIEDSECRVFVATAELAPEVGGLPQDISTVDRWLMLDGVAPGFEDFNTALSQCSHRATMSEFQGAPMMYTSGTTGFPKGVKPPLAEIAPDEPPKLLALLGKLYDFNGDTIYLSTGPLYHAAPLKFNLGVQTMGGTSVVLKKFDAETALKAIQAHRVSHSQWVPTMFNRLLQLPESTRNAYDLSSHRVAIHAAAPCPVELKHKMLDWWGPILHEYYAGSESVGMTAIDSHQWLTHVGSVGQAVKGEIHIQGPDEQDLPAGEAGLIFFANGGEFSYHNDPEKTARSKNSKGWATFGDIGYVDEEGYLYLTDRRDYVINSGGVNIYPQESEDVLSQHPLVEDVAVFGIPNEDFGEEVKAVVQLYNPAMTGKEMEAELIEYCHAKLSKIKCPKSIDFVDVMPREPTGKLLKRKLQAKYLQPTKE